MAEAISPIQLPEVTCAQSEREWLQNALQQRLDREYPPEPVNQEIAAQAAHVYIRQRMEGENEVGAIAIALITEMQAFDFSQSFYGECAVANMVSELLLERMGIASCCGRG
ncbi:hypothetical protein [Geitlerinema sp. PCC 9228]|jgi:hypothetical protein|uniref:hypothetical protein n=1 Tax=Geitlerinema sp. PCC 9228 TaxID=111611 RepID=UPI0008F9A107|nr:hypothetical protein [Geitlerinema sp. PCC 9228]